MPLSCSNIWFDVCLGMPRCVLAEGVMSLVAVYVVREWMGIMEKASPRS